METTIIASLLVFLNMLSSEPFLLSDYDLKGKVQQVREVTYQNLGSDKDFRPSSENMVKTDEFVFNKEGVLLSEKSTYKGLEEGISKFEMDAQGNLSKVVISEANNTIEKIDFVKNDKDNVSSFRVLQNGESQGYVKNMFTAGKLLKVVLEDMNNKVLRTVAYNIGQDSRKISIRESEGPIFNIEQEYENGNLIRRTGSDGSGFVFIVEDYERNSQGDVIKLTTAYPDSIVVIQHFEYQYDEFGNWVQQTATDETGKAWEKMVREIQYY